MVSARRDMVIGRRGQERPGADSLDVFIAVNKSPMPCGCAEFWRKISRGRWDSHLKPSRCECLSPRGNAKQEDRSDLDVPVRHEYKVAGHSVAAWLVGPTR